MGGAISPLHTSLAAGAAAGGVGLLVFLVLHHLWIVPIWFVAPFGLIVALGGGLALGWAHAELLPHLPPRPWAAVAILGFTCMTLLPALVLAELRQPLFDVSAPGGAVLLVRVPYVAAIFVVELLVTATVAGALLGWWLGRSARASLAAGLAAFIFALGPGHNIPFGGGLPSVPLEVGIMAIVAAASALALVEVHARLSGSD